MRVDIDQPRDSRKRPQIDHERTSGYSPVPGTNSDHGVTMDDDDRVKNRRCAGVDELSEPHCRHSNGLAIGLPCNEGQGESKCETESSQEARGLLAL
jgi:hypothetical protein